MSQDSGLLDKEFGDFSWGLFSLRIHSEFCVSCFILKFCSLCFSGLTSCLCPVSCPCGGLHLFHMCFTCVQSSLPPSCMCVCVRVCVCKSQCFPLSFTRRWTVMVFLSCFQSLLVPCVFSCFLQFSLESFILTCWFYRCLIQGHFLLFYLLCICGSSCTPQLWQCAYKSY